MNEEITNEIQPEETPNESFRNRIATVDAKGKRKWVFAQKPQGKFYNIRTYTFLCVTVYKNEWETFVPVQCS